MWSTVSIDLRPPRKEDTHSNRITRRLNSSSPPPPATAPSLSNRTRTNLIFPATSGVCYQYISTHSETSMSNFTSLSFRNTSNEDLNQQAICQLNARTTRRNLPSTVRPGCGSTAVETSVIFVSILLQADSSKHTPGR